MTAPPPSPAAQGEAAICAAGLAANRSNPTDETEIRRVVPVARAAALSVKSRSESTGWQVGEFTGLPIALYQNWLYEMNRQWRFTDGTLCVLWCVEFPHARSDYAKNNTYIRSTRRDYNNGKHQAPAPAEPCVAYDRWGNPLEAVQARGPLPTPPPVSAAATLEAPPTGRGPQAFPADGSLERVDRLEHASDGLKMDHFEALRERIGTRLRETGAQHARRQTEEFAWLYGALGQVPSKVMLVCENPSLSGVEKAHFRTINGGPPTIEDQWAGGPTSNCITRLRPALCELGLKLTPPDRPGGWRCYITKVIKEADVVRDFTARDKQSLAIHWADVLAWEIEQVRPSVMFTVGDAATQLVRTLQEKRLIPAFPRSHKVMHYSNRGSGVTDAFVRSSIARDLRSGLS
jgi:hypothetical protein